MSFDSFIPIPNPRNRPIQNRLPPKAVNLQTSPETLQQTSSEEKSDPPLSVLLDVAGMMGGACVSRVKSILSSNAQVGPFVVNMLMETASVRLNADVSVSGASAAEEFARKLTECGFPTRKRASGLGIEAKVMKWKETVARKEALMIESRNRVVFAWTLVALCCGSHASHIAYSIGIHIGHCNC